MHGVFLNGYLWRHVLARLSDIRRCIAIDLLAHGETRTAADADLSFTEVAEMLEVFCEALDLAQVDLVGNDSGGALAQIFAANHPERLRTLTLTNCDVHDNWPPEEFAATRQLVADGKLGQLGDAMRADLETARTALGVGYEHPERVSAEAVQAYIGPLAGQERTRQLERWFAALDNAHTVAVEDKLRRLTVPTLIVWGTGDQFFDVKWAYWLRDTIPGARKVVELDGARLFFPEERPDELADALREHWTSVSVAATAPGGAAG